MYHSRLQTYFIIIYLLCNSYDKNTLKKLIEIYLGMDVYRLIVDEKI